MPLDVCSTCGQPARYRCPGCSAQSCSVACVEQHKQAAINNKKEKCAGKRNKAAYIAPRAYGYGALMDDYAYLEEVNRVVAEAGSKRKAVDQLPSNRAKSHHDRPLWAVKAQRQKVHVVLLDTGMERSRSNQTKWNQKTESIHYTISFIFKLADGQVDFVLTTHNNPSTKTINEILSKPLSDGRGKAVAPSNKRLEILKTALSEQSLTFLLPVVKDPRKTSFAFERAEPESRPLPPLISSDGKKLHPSLPNRPTTFSSTSSIPELQPPTQTPPLNGISTAKTVTKVKGLTRPTLPTYLQAHNPAPMISQTASTTETSAPTIETAPVQYNTLYGTLSLQDQLRNRTIIEWPAIEVWADDDFERFRKSVIGLKAMEIVDNDSDSDFELDANSHSDLENLSKDRVPSKATAGNSAWSAGGGAERSQTNLLSLAQYASDSEEEVATQLTT